MATKPRRIIRCTVELSCAPGTTKIQALRELRTRVNESCCYSLEPEDVRVKRAT